MIRDFTNDGNSFLGYYLSNHNHNDIKVRIDNIHTLLPSVNKKKSIITNSYHNECLAIFYLSGNLECFIDYLISCLLFQTGCYSLCDELITNLKRKLQNSDTISAGYDVGVMMAFTMFHEFGHYNNYVDETEKLLYYNVAEGFCQLWIEEITNEGLDLDGYIIDLKNSSDDEFFKDFVERSFKALDDCESFADNFVNLLKTWLYDQQKIDELAADIFAIRNLIETFKELNIISSEEMAKTFGDSLLHSIYYLNNYTFAKFFLFSEEDDLNLKEINKSLREGSFLFGSIRFLIAKISINVFINDTFGYDGEFNSYNKIVEKSQKMMYSTIFLNYKERNKYIQAFRNDETDNDSSKMNSTFDNLMSILPIARELIK